MPWKRCSKIGKSARSVARIERIGADGHDTYCSPRPPRPVARPDGDYGGPVSDYVYSMYRADKFYGSDGRCSRTSRSRSCTGAKIGVLGPNGGGKSTLLRIMAGSEETSSGEAELAPGATRRPARAGARARPGQGRARQRRGRRARDCATCSTASTRSRPPSPSPTPTSTRCSPSRPKVQERDRPPRRLVARGDARPRDGRAASARRRPRRDDALGRRAAARRALPAPALRPPTCCCSTSRPTTSTPNRSSWLERFLADYKGAVIAVTHDRYFLDNVAGWILELDRGTRHPVRGQLLLLARAEAGAARDRGEDRSRRAGARSRASSSGCA